MLILLPTFENTSDIFLYFVVDYQSEHPPMYTKSPTVKTVNGKESETLQVSVVHGRLGV